jgi:uncharacterized membrane protein YjjB (DUF3815 family)
VVRKTPSTVFIIVGLIPLVPGASLYRCMEAFATKNEIQGVRIAVYTLLFAACMSAGVVLMTTMFRLIRGRA